MSDNPVFPNATRSERVVEMQKVIDSILGDKSNQDNRCVQNEYFHVQSIISDGKCWSPYTQCKGIKRKRVVKATTRKHCWDNGHLEGGRTYRPLVRYQNLFFYDFSIILIYFLF